MMNVEDGELLRETARYALSSELTRKQAAALAAFRFWRQQTGPAEGWHPAEAVLIAFETGRVAASSSWATEAVAAAVVGACPRLSGLAADLLAGVKSAAACLAGSSAADTDSCDPTTGFAGTVVAEQVPDVVTVFDATGDRARVLATDAPGVALIEDASSLDTVRRVFRVHLEGARPDVVEDSAVSRLRLVAQLLVAADTIGAVNGATEMVSRYLSDRAAFGAPIASFQAIQHRLVDLTVFGSAADALARSAAQALAAGDPKAERLVVAIHAFTETRAVAAIDDCIQLAGGIGFTWEFPVHHLLRRASTNASAFGSGRASRNRLATVGGW
jgi:hypothetical protein